MNDINNENLYLDNFSNKVLELIILLTENCNFRCSYCYETFDNSNKEDDYFKRIRKLIDKRYAEIEHIKIGWFGGEPLLEIEEIVSLSKYIKILLNDKFEDKFVGYMSTNGYLLTPEISKKLINLNTKIFQITIDGTEEMHNRTRKLINGEGTFKRIFDNILYLHNTTLNFRINLRINIYNENKENIIKLIELLNFSIGNDERFKIYYRPVADYGQKKDKDYKFIDNLEYIKYLEKYKKCNSKIEEVLEHNDEYICYACRPDCIVLRPNCMITKCTIGLDDEINNIGNINMKGELIIDQNKYRKWISSFINKDQISMRCPRREIEAKIGNIKNLTTASTL